MPAPTPPPLPNRLRILLDENVPHGLARMLGDHDVTTALAMGWDNISNGALIAAAEEAQFHIMVTTDQNLGYQQNMTGRKLAILVIAGTNKWRVIRDNAEVIRGALDGMRDGAFATVPIIEPGRRRPPRRLLKPDIQID